MAWRIRILRTGQWLVAVIVGAIFSALRLIPPARASDIGGAVASFLGPRIPRSDIARRQLRMAYPGISHAEVERITKGVWENLGRTALEYPHLDKLWDYELGRAPGAGRIEVEGIDYFLALRESRRPTIIFTAHLANWELLAVCAAHYKLPVAVFFRRPNNPYINRLIGKIRGENMGTLLPTDIGGAISAARLLDEGKHIGLLVDQHFSRGPALPFFGLPAHTAPTLARLALQFNCAVHGARVERLPHGRFRVSIEPAIALPQEGTRDEKIVALMSEVNRTVERWVREHPEQWLWLHRRWRDAPKRPPKRRPAPKPKNPA